MEITIPKKPQLPSPAPSKEKVKTTAATSTKKEPTDSNKKHPAASLITSQEIVSGQSATFPKEATKKDKKKAATKTVAAVAKVVTELTVKKPVDLAPKDVSEKKENPSSDDSKSKEQEQKDSKAKKKAKAS